jgi:hypothetical protein
VEQTNRLFGEAKIGLLFCHNGIKPPIFIILHPLFSMNLLGEKTFSTAKRNTE